MISVHELSKGYGDIKALEGLSFEVQGGELFGVLGPDGAGKTTFLRTILGQIPAYSGTTELGASLKVGYFAQAHEDLKEEN